MLKLYALTAVVLYGAFCWGTQPPQCFTPRYALECQRVQLDQMIHFRPAVTWGAVDSVRRF